MLDVILFFLLILVLGGAIAGILFFALGLREKTIQELETNSGSSNAEEEEAKD